MSNTSNWHAILTPSMQEYALVRIADGLLQIKVNHGLNYVVNLDVKVIPQLINILTQLEKEI